MRRTLVLAMVLAVLAASNSEARPRRAPARESAPVAEPLTTGSLRDAIPTYGPNGDRRLTSQDGGTIHWNTGDRWGNLGSPSGGGGGGSP